MNLAYPCLVGDMARTRDSGCNSLCPSLSEICEQDSRARRLDCAEAGVCLMLLLLDDLFVCFVCFVALRPKSTAMVIAGRSVHLTTLFPGQA